jgi:hypothetical protein
MRLPLPESVAASATGCRPVLSPAPTQDIPQLWIYVAAAASGGVLVVMAIYIWVK